LRQLIQTDDNVKFYAISIDTPEESRKFLEKIGVHEREKMNFQFLYDQGHQVIDAYGIRDPAYNGQQFEGLPRPAVYIIDTNGRVAWAKVEDDYKKRPSNEELRAALESIKQRPVN
jgi:peroxiredoxin